ncbi:MAG: M14 family zinc carboxypeptidase [Chloroflexota bacterium]
MGLALVSAVVALGVVPIPASAYPPEDSAYLDNAEMVAAIQSIAGAHPGIVQLFSVGTSHEGRTLWAAKVSDNVATDEDEPEVMFDAGIHAREPMSTEMAVALLRNLAEGHATIPRVTNLVNGHEIYILFNLNPDGSEFDHGTDVYHLWRKNRQPTPDPNAIGTDINRNFEYRWGTNPLNASPFADTYRGSSAWSTPEAAAFRDFVASRVIGGEQQISVHVTLHQHGRVVLYPYGYTTAAVPADMSADDHDVLVTMAAEMARRSGYVSAQSSAWAGINVGNQMDWLYATHGVMTFTFEMGDAFYMPDEAIPTETARNVDAAYYAIEQASCPYAVVGLEAVYCDPSGFTDIAESPFKTEIRWAAETGLTRGCASDRFCPLNAVTREQMASFLARVLDLPSVSGDYFTDDAGSPHEPDINRIAAAGLTLGCGGSRFCPAAGVTREQMASFLRRAYSLSATDTDFFADDAGSPHEPDINRLAASGITRGCTPTAYCPMALVTREQMVTFLYRAEN